MILHLIRHPKPQVEPGICYGRLDIPAQIAAAELAHLRTLLPPGLPLWSSPLQRCRSLAEQLHAQPRFDGRLAEIDFGAWEGRAWDDLPRPEIDAWAADVAGYAPPGGESPRQLQARVWAWLGEMVAAEAVVVTHAGVIRALRGDWLAASVAYASLTTVDMTETRRMLRGANR